MSNKIKIKDKERVRIRRKVLRAVRKKVREQLVDAKETQHEQA